MPKERLDLMVDGSVKQLLKTVAAAEGVSMSRLVEMMLLEHLSDRGDDTGPMHAVADLLRIQRLQERFTEAMAAGRIYSFRTFNRLVAQGRASLDEGPLLLYVATNRGRFFKDQILNDYLVDEVHEDMISTYDDTLRTVSVRIDWLEDDDGSISPRGLRIWPRGRANFGESLFDWDCPIEWPGMLVDGRLARNSVTDGADGHLSSEYVG